MKTEVAVYVINVDWYFNLHWLQRARALKDAGAEVHVVMSVTNADNVDKLNREGFLCHQWNIERKSMNPVINFLRFIELYRLLSKIKPDIIHAITIKPNLFVGLMSYFIKIPYVLSVTGTGIIFSGKSWQLKMARPFIRGLYKLPQYNKTPYKIIFENQEDKSYFIDTGLCGDHEAVTILGAGVDTDIFKVTTIGNDHQPVILFAARLLWDKGLGDLLEASKILRQKGLDFTIWVAGIVDQDTINAIDMDLLKDWNQAGVIEWLGTETDMPGLMAKTDIVVLPTFYGEGVPRVLIEAAACARPVITTNIAGCREIVQDGVNGLLVPARDIKALARAMERLLLSPDLRRQMGQSGRELVENSFSEQQVISETMSLYCELLQ
ncbi:MAG: glycosyltransferase [Methyloprofundus sp.]|nr:glycosyltransferase [Methyloprofundus sp.]